MVALSQVPKHHLNINTYRHGRSLSSLSATSDAAAFHSAHTQHSNMELRQFPFTQHCSPVLTSLPLTISTKSHIQPLFSLKLRGMKMDRQDSGYAGRETSHSTPQSPTLPTSPTPSRPPSTSPSLKRLSSSSNATSNRPKRRTTNSSSSSTTRPSTKRASRSSATSQLRTSNPGSRPTVSSRHSTPHTPQQTEHPYQFFQFPSLADASPPNPTSTAVPTPSNIPSTIPQPPPSTVQYWTSDSTRRLEYAAIDAASKGVRGFFVKLLPDCVLPASSRRTKFHGHNDAESDCGSVRRYRLVLPEEKGSECCAGGERGGSRKRGLLRRWTSFGRRGGRMD